MKTPCLSYCLLGSNCYYLEQVVIFTVGFVCQFQALLAAVGNFQVDRSQAGGYFFFKVSLTTAKLLLKGNIKKKKERICMRKGDSVSPVL